MIVIVQITAHTNNGVFQSTTTDTERMKQKTKQQQKNQISRYSDGFGLHGHPQRTLANGILQRVLWCCFMLVVACNEQFDFKNTQPVVSAIGPVGMTDANDARIHLWIVDYEGDPVDVDIQISVDGGQWQSLTAEEISGHGLLGLTSDTVFPGQEHVVTWHTNVSSDLGREFDVAQELRLRIVPDDRRSGGGVLLTTPSFKLIDGLSEPYTQLDPKKEN